MKTFRSAPSVATKEYRRSLERIASRVYKNAVRNSPVGKYKGGGNLRQSIKKYPYGHVGFLIRVNAEYGVYVDQGTRPHTIYPRRKKILAWRTESGRWAYAKKVNHPGTKATHFFTNAVKDAETYANREMSQATNRILRTIAND